MQQIIHDHVKELLMRLFWFVYLTVGFDFHVYAHVPFPFCAFLHSLVLSVVMLCLFGVLGLV